MRALISYVSPAADPSKSVQARPRPSSLRFRSVKLSSISANSRFFFSYSLLPFFAKRRNAAAHSWVRANDREEYQRVETSASARKKKFTLENRQAYRRIALGHCSRFGNFPSARWKFSRDIRNRIALSRMLN